MSPTLAHTPVTHPDHDPPGRWLYMLHGIYGMGRNWGSIARRFVDARPEWGALLVDIRNHGESQGFEGPHTVEAAAQDLTGLVDGEGYAPGALLGHSFGGKVVLEAARHLTAEQVWVIDSTPDARKPEGTAWTVVDTLRALPGPFGSRGEAIDALVECGYPKPLAQWLAMNVQPADDGRYRWRIDPETMEEMLRDFFARDLWEIVEHPPEGTSLHFVKGLDSDTLIEPAARRIERAAADPRVHLHRIPGGHWLNTENPDDLLDLLVEQVS